MDDARARANLVIARHVEVREPGGQLWTVHIVRPGDPRSLGIRRFNWYPIVIGIKRLGRLISRDRSWNVELMPGPFEDERRHSTVRSTEPDKDAAIEAAVRLAREIQSG